MSIKIGIGKLRIGVGGSQSWESYWITQNIFDFFWVEGAANVTATELIDESGNGNNITITGKDFAAAYIPATSAATFDCPNNATFIADDTDNLWINKNEESRGVEVSELIGYDFGKTIVWYDDASPHHIRAIGILKSTVTLTQAQIDRLHTDFHLALFWSGVENVNGFIKANRGLAQSVWTAVSEAALDYSDTYQTAVLADGGIIVNRKVLESEYQRLIDTGNILSCWHSYHYQCGVKKSIVDYGGEVGEHDMVYKWYNLSPVAGRFAESVICYSITPATSDARPEYTDLGLQIRRTNLGGLTRCGLQSPNPTTLPNNNNQVKIRGIIIPLSAGSTIGIAAKGFNSDGGFNAVYNITGYKLSVSYYGTAATRTAATIDDFFALSTETEFSILFDYTTGLIKYYKGDTLIQTIDISTNAPVYPSNALLDLVGCARDSARSQFDGYIKQLELFNL